MEWHASGKPTECPLRRHCLLQPRSLDPKPQSRSNIELKPCGWPCLCLLQSAGLPTFTMTAHWGTQQRTGLWMGKTYDPHDAVIILNTHKWGEKFFQKKFGHQLRLS